MGKDSRHSISRQAGRRSWFSRAACFALALAGVGLAGAGTAVASNFPDKPVRLVVPFGAGGSDVIARAFADRLSAVLKQPVIVENRPGGGGLVGAQHVANSSADGYTMLWLGGGSLTPVLRKDLKFEILKELKSVVAIARGGMTFMVGQDVPATNLDEFIAYAKKNDGKLNYSHTAASILLATEMFKRQAGFDAVAVAYKGSSQVMTALLSNEIQMAIDVPLFYMPMIKEGKIRALVHGGQERSPSLPDVPTLAEVGIKDLTFAFSYGIWVAADTPDPIVRTLNEAFNTVLKEPDIRNRLAQASVVPIGGEPDVHARQTAAEHAMWARAAETIGFKPW